MLMMTPSFFSFLAIMGCSDFWGFVFPTSGFFLSLLVPYVEIHAI